MAWPRLFAPRTALRPAAPLTPELVALRPRAMMWCSLAIVMLLTNMTLKGRPMLAVITALVAAVGFWMLWRYIRGQFLSDVAFWTPQRIAAWDAGQRDMAVIARMVEPPPRLLQLCPPQPPHSSTPIQSASAEPGTCCCATRHSRELLQ